VTNLTENSVWESGIYQLETDDPTLGGPPGFNLGEPVTGHANAQAQQLANRTSYLKNTHEVFVSDLANATDPAKGAGLVGWNRGTVHSESRDLGEKARTEQRSVLDFIPKSQHSAILGGTSTWDASAAVNYAIRELGGGEILIPKGVRLAIAAPIDIIRGTLLKGGGPFDDAAGVGSKIYLLPGSNCPMLRTPAAILGASAATHFMGLENLLFDGNKSGQTVESEAVQFHGVWVGSWLRNIAIHNALGSALTLQAGSDLEIDHLWILGTQSESGYAFDTNKDIATGAQGLLNINHMYVENTSNKAGGAPRTVEADRGKNIRLHRLVTCNINEVHTEGALRPIDLEANHLVRIGKVSAAFCGVAAEADSAIVRNVGNGNRSISIGAMESYRHADGTKFVGLSAGTTSNNFQELPMENPTVPYVGGYTAVNADGYGTQRQAPTIFSRSGGVQAVGGAATSTWRFYNSTLGSSHYLKQNGQTLSIGSNWLQPSSADKNFIDIFSSGNAGDRVDINVPFRLPARSSANTIAATAMWRCDTNVGFGVGPVYQRSVGSNADADTIATVRRGSGAPTISADYIGQQYVDITNRAGYMAVNFGTGATDWKQVTA
jgi:hypothetical protein